MESQNAVVSDSHTQTLMPAAPGREPNPAAQVLTVLGYKPYLGLLASPAAVLCCAPCAAASAAPAAVLCAAGAGSAADFAFERR